MHTMRPGQLLFAIGCLVLGALTVTWNGFYKEWLPLANELGRYGSVAEFCGIVLLLAGAGLLSKRTARFSAFALTLFWLALLFAKMPMLRTHLFVEEYWEDFSESLIFVTGSWTIFLLASPRDRSRDPVHGLTASRLLFALALPAIGLSHIFYLKLTASLIPAWMPAHTVLAYATGAAHIAAGIGIFLALLPRLAATLEAVMVSLFTLLVWVPILGTNYASRSDWSEICVSTLISGASWAVAASLRRRPWLEISVPGKLTRLLRRSAHQPRPRRRQR